MPKIHHLQQDFPDHAIPVLYALSLWQMPMSQTRLHDFLMAAQIPLGIDFRYTVANVKTAIADLLAGGSVHLVAGMGYQVSTEIAHATLVHMSQRHQLRHWVQQLREFLTNNREYAGWSSPSSAFCQREMLFAACVGDLALLGKWRAQYFAFANAFDTLPAHQLFSTEAGATLFAAFDKKAQSILLFDLFSAASWMLEQCGAAYQYATTHLDLLISDDSMLADALGMQALLRGRPDDVLPQLQQERGNDQFALAVQEMMRGDALRSDQIFQKILVARKTEAGKRKLFVPDLPGLFYTVSQLASPGAQGIKAAKEQCDDGCKLRQSQFYPALKPLVDHLKNGTHLSAEPAAPHHLTLDDYFVRLACFWRDADLTDADRRHLKNLYLLARRHDYLWVAAEIAELYRTQTGDAIDATADDGWHAAHGLRPLRLARQRQATWQRALAALSALQNHSGGSEPGARVVWLLDCDRHYINLEPREQKRGAKGGWSKGRPIALKRLSYDQDSLPGITEQDRKIATCIRKSYDNYYGASDYEINGEKALPLLVGHPLVYWQHAPDVRIDIVRGEPALIMTQQGDQIRMQLEPPMHTDEPVIWIKQTPTRLAVYPGGPEIRQIAAIIGAGLSVPATAKAELVDVIAAIAPHLNIHADLPELTRHSAQRIAQVDADPTLYVHLLPLKDGLRLQFLVRPLPAPEGNWFSPGKGAANVVGEHDGAPVQTTRNLELEQSLLDRTLRHCQSLAQAQQQGQEWELDHPELCLEFLHEVDQLKSNQTDRIELVWPEGERFRIRSAASAAQLQLSIRSQGDWFMAGGELRLDDGQVMALREVLQLMRHASGRFVPLGDNQFIALTDSFRKRLLELNAVADDATGNTVRVNRLAAGLLAELADEAAQVDADAAWQAQLEKIASLADFVPQLPSTLQGTLRDYQEDGFRWLARLAHWGVGACLADDMGLGKTVQTLALLLDRAADGPALVVAPVSVTMNWINEAARFAPTLQIRAYGNQARQQRHLGQPGPFDVVVTSYGMLQQDDAAFAAIHWHTVVLDEAQVIKNAATKRSQAAMALQADFRMIASGTPVENHLGELWNLFRFINPGLLGSWEQFSTRFASPIERGDRTARNHLKRLIQPFILRRTKTQVLAELPARTEITLQVALSEQERHLYEALRQEALVRIEQTAPDQGKAMQVLAEITRLRRFCCHPGLAMPGSSVEGSKLAVFAEVVEELLENHHKALVFSQFVDHLAIVRKWLEQNGIHYQYLDGSTPQAQRKQRVDAFQAGEGDVFLISLKAGGTGLNLTAADYVIHLDPWWNPAVEDQASDRAHRMGQQRPVTIYRLVTEQTIEEKIIALHAQKRDLADSLLEGGDVSARLDTAALLKLLSEGPAAQDDAALRSASSGLSQAS